MSEKKKQEYTTGGLKTGRMWNTRWLRQSTGPRRR